MTRSVLAPILALAAASLAGASLTGAPPAAAAAAGAAGGSVPGGGPSHAADAVPRPLPFFYDLYSFRGEGGSTAVVASFAVRAGRLDRAEAEDEVRYRFNVTLVLVDTARGGVSRSDDSVYVAMDRPLNEDHLVHTYVETEARPSSSIVQRVIMIDGTNPGTGQLYTSGYEIPDYSGDELMLSDIALGLPGSEAGWSRGDATLALLPSSHFPRGAFEVYYEIYNLPRDSRYTTEISFQPVDEDDAPLPGEDRTVRVRFSAEAASGPDDTLAELRRVDASLPRGRHRLTVKVTDLETGRTASRSRVLQVREWREGATLVAGCPAARGADTSHCEVGRG